MHIKILDTSVILEQRLDLIVEDFKVTEEETLLVIPLRVIGEIDRNKKGNEKKNENARHATRYLEELRLVQNLYTIRKLSDTLSIVVDCTEEDIDSFKNTNTVDMNLLQLAQDYKDNLKDCDIEILCNDTNVRLISDIVFNDEIKSAPYLEYQQTSYMYSGRAELEFTDKQIQELITKKEISIDEELLPNQLIDIVDTCGSHTFGIYDGVSDKIKLLKESYQAWGIKPYKENNEVMTTQKMFMHMLLDPSIEMITAAAPAGVGKTFLAIAAALQQTLDGKKYDKILIMRPMAEADKEIGALPGSKIEKLSPWLAGPIDNLKTLLKTKLPYPYTPVEPINDIIEDLLERDSIEFESFSFLRGRSLEKTFIIIDDFQNATKEQANLAVTRAGKGSKIVFLGDVSKRQIDNPQLTPLNNGLRYLIDHMAGKDPSIAHVVFGEEEVVRSKIAKLAVKLLP